MRKFLAFSAVAEIGVALAMLIAPALVIRWLLGLEASAAGILLGRFFGIALLALEVACWPSRANGRASFRALLIYNVLFALYLAYLGTAGGLGGWLLWPAVAFHAVVALLLGWTQRGAGRAEAAHA